MNGTSDAKQQISALTGLRFVAAMAVFLHHHPQPAYLPGVLSTFFSAGYNGVTIFFVLSGFVIGLNYLDMLAQPTWLKLARYIVARLARIYPLYLLVLGYVWLEQGAVWSDNLFTHVLALQAWSPDLNVAFAFNSPGWSIGVEFFLYACFPLLALCQAPLRQRQRLVTAAIAVTSVLILLAVYFQVSGRATLPIQDAASAHRWLYRTPLTRLGDFLLGIVAALLYTQSAHDSRTTIVWGRASYGVLGVIIALMMWDVNLLSAYSWDVAYAPLTGLLILGLTMAPHTRLSRWLGTPWMVSLGEASYALYLIHVPLMRIFDIPHYINFEPWVAILLWIGFGAICLALAHSLNIFVEAPLRHLINNWAKQWLKSS